MVVPQVDQLSRRVSRVARPLGIGAAEWGLSLSFTGEVDLHLFDDFLEDGQGLGAADEKLIGEDHGRDTLKAKVKRLLYIRHHGRKIAVVRQSL